MAAATASLSARCVRFAFAGDKKCGTRASCSRNLESAGTSACLTSRALFLPDARGDERKRVESRKGLIAERSKCSSNGKRRFSPGSVRAEIFIEEAQEDVEDTMTIPNTQTAWIYKEYGSREVLGIAEVCVLKVHPDQVLVKVYAAALNPVDSKRRMGRFKNSDSELPTVPGYDLAGVVLEVGSEVTKFKVGDRVYGDVSEHALNGPKQYGSLAQYCVVEERLMAVIPRSLSFEEAASLPLALETAYQGFERAGLKEGQTVLVLGGAGGVGSLAVQLAKQVFKASLVAATTSTSKMDFVKGLGADIVIDYKNEGLPEHPNKYDVIFDTVGKGEGVQVVKENGRVVAITGPADPPAFRFVVISKGDVLEKLNPLFEDGTLKPIIDTNGRFKFSELVEAFGYLEEGRTTGKVVISMN